MIHTVSATPLDKVMVESSPGGRAHVWLRRNVTHGVSELDGQTAVYEADEIHYLAEEAPTVDEVEASFDVLWAQHEGDDLSVEERLRQRVSDLEAALAEVADLIAGA